MAKILETTAVGNLSVKELIELLQRCPDQDAWIVVPVSTKLDNFRHDPFHTVVAVRTTDSATVELVTDGDKGWY